MQLFFVISTSGIDSANWSKRKVAEHVTAYFDALDASHAVQYDHMEGTGWNAYKVLVTLPDEKAALAMRKEVERRCHLVSSQCRPYYFRARRAHVANVNDLSLFGLTADETERYNALAPAGVKRTIVV